MYRRTDLLTNTCTHSQYYSQFVTSRLMARVSVEIGLSRIVHSNDENFNDIPLKEWDSLAYLITGRFTLAEKVCILKETASHLRRNLKIS